jgi:hypothetical protein
MKGPTQTEMLRYSRLPILLTFRTAHNLLNRKASAVAVGLHGTRAIAMQTHALPAIGIRLCHGGVVGANRSDRLLRSFVPN